MSSVQASNVNPNMKNNDLNIGILTPPDGHYKPTLYSDTQASNNFRSLRRDVYSKQVKIDFEDTKKTPKTVAVLGAGAVLTGLGFGIKKLFTKK